MDTQLADLGLSTYFSQQLSLDEMQSGNLARVTEQQRSHIVANNGHDDLIITLGGAWFQLPALERPTVGDWILLDDSNEKILRLLERKSVFKRIAAGNKVEVQLIAANIDTLFIISSCNDDFNESRLERYLALAAEAAVDPVLVLTKSDLTDDPDQFRVRAVAIKPDLPVEVVNALDPASLSNVSNWVSPGATVALVGSSGVGKSTIVNSLSGTNRTETAGIREQDAKGRHTTSFRALYPLPGGGLLIDVPGMRELKVANLEDALPDVFEDIETLSRQCKFSDCAHNDEPDCAVRQALEAGQLEERRYQNYQKLLREDARHTATLAQQRAQDRQFGKTVKQHMAIKQRSKTLD